MSPLEYVFENIRKKGLYGLFSNPEFGKTTLMYYFARCFAAAGDKCLFISLDLSKEWLFRKVCQPEADNLEIIDDVSLFLPGKLSETIESKSPDVVFIDYLQLLGPVCRDAAVSLNKLKELSDKFSIPIMFTSRLPRCSGDYDPFDRCPELYDLTFLFPSEKTMDEIHRAINQIDTIMFLHRHHDCARGTGTAHRYNISDNAEIILKNGFYPDSSVIRFEKQDIFGRTLH